jgi:hypothetical protein
MTFELEADGVRFWCSSPFWTRKLVEKGARLVDESQAEHLQGPLEHPRSAQQAPPAERVNEA